MHVGVFSYNTEYGIRVDDLAPAIEERGFDSLWASEHTHIPAGSEATYAGGGELPEAFYHIADPFVSLMAAAAVTKTLKLATAVCQVIAHDPICLAKTVATLDYLSNGRFLFAVGGGWNNAEVANHGVAFGKRWKIVRERVEAMKVIWTEEEASYQGEFVNFSRVISYPKPVQKPFPPIIMGSANELARKRVARYCDGWLPVDSRFADLAAAIADLYVKVEEAGREPDEISVSVFCAGETTPDTLRRYRDMGVDRSIIMAPDAGRDAVLGFLDGFANVVDEVACGSL